MVNIYCAGCYFEEVWLSYDILYGIMTDDFIRQDDFIKFRFGEGEKGAIRKKDINSFCECRQTV